jgi:hypothetical protein
LNRPSMAASMATGEGVRGRGFVGRCVPAGPPLLRDLIALGRNLDDPYGENRVRDVLHAVLAMRGVQPNHPCDYAPYADPLIVRCAGRGRTSRKQHAITRKQLITTIIQLMTTTIQLMTTIIQLIHSSS